MTMTLVERLRGLLAKATKGPWRSVRMKGHTVSTIFAGADGDYSRCVLADGDGDDADADLIVETINALPALLDALERLQMPGREEIARAVHDAVENDDDSGGGAYLRAADAILALFAARV